MTPETMGKLVYMISRDPALQDNFQVKALSNALSSIKDSSKLKLVSDNSQISYDSYTYLNSLYEKERDRANEMTKGWNEEVYLRKAKERKLYESNQKVSALKETVKGLKGEVARLTAENAASAGLKLYIRQVIEETRAASNG